MERRPGHRPAGGSDPGGPVPGEPRQPAQPVADALADGRRGAHRRHRADRLRSETGNGSGRRLRRPQRRVDPPPETALHLLSGPIVVLFIFLSLSLSLPLSLLRFAALPSFASTLGLFYLFYLVLLSFVLFFFVLPCFT